MFLCYFCRRQLGLSWRTQRRREMSFWHWLESSTDDLPVSLRYGQNSSHTSIQTMICTTRTLNQIHHTIKCWLALCHLLLLMWGDMYSWHKSRKSFYSCISMHQAVLCRPVLSHVQATQANASGCVVSTCAITCISNASQCISIVNLPGLYSHVHIV